MTPDTVIFSHRLNVLAVVTADGSASLCGVVTKSTHGAEIIGNGTLPNPLTVKLSPLLAEAPNMLRRAAAALSHTIDELGRHPDAANYGDAEVVRQELLALLAGDR